MGKVIYIRSGDGVLLRFEDPARVRAWIASGRLALTDLHLAADQTWHPLSELIDLSGAFVQAPPPAEAPASLPPAPDAIAPTAEMPIVSPGRKRKNGGPTQREPHPFRKTDLVPAEPPANLPAAFPETLATAPFPAIRETPAEPVTEPLPVVVPPPAPEAVAAPVPEAPRAAAQGAPAPAPADLDQPLVFPAEDEPFPKPSEGDWWASDPIGASARKRAALRRSALFAALVILGAGGVAALVILTRGASIPEIPPAPATKAAEAPAPAAAPVVAEAPAPAEAPAAAAAPVVAEAAPAAGTVEAPAKAPDPVAAPARIEEPVPAPAKAPVVAAPEKPKAPEPAPKPAAPVPVASGMRELPPAPRVSPTLREPAAAAPAPAGEEPATYDGHMAAGNRLVTTAPAVALDHFRMAAQARPNRVEPVARMGDCAVRMGDLDTAEQHYRAALKLGASYAPALVGMARVQKARGSVTDAKYYYTRYLEVNPKGAQADEAQSYLERNP